MPKLTVVSRAGTELELEVSDGTSLMEGIRDGGVAELLAVCGGCCSCATCHVFVDEQWFGKVGEPSGFEIDLLDTSEHRRPTSRLACQVVMAKELDGLRVTISPED